MPGPTAEHSTRHSGLCRYWLAGSALSLTPALRLISRSPALPLLAPAPPSVLPPWFISLHFAGLSHLSVSLYWLLSVFFPHLQLCLSLSVVSPYLRLSPSLSLPHLCLFPSLPARVGPGGSGTARPGRRGEQCAIHTARWRHGNAPALPSLCAGRACQKDAMVTSGACPLPRAAAAPCTIGGAGPAGGAGLQPGSGVKRGVPL